MPRKPLKVVILGGGPSALFAWYGARDAGYDWDEVQVRAEKKSYPPGAFWLHEVPVPRFKPDNITVRLEGTAEQYSINQWGKAYPTSASQYKAPQVLKAYNPHELIPKFWDVINFKFQPGTYTKEAIEGLAEAVPYVIQTFPTHPGTLEIMRMYQFPVYSTTYDVKKDPGNLCLYNGTVMEDEFHVNRTTKAFGHASFEFTRQYPKDLKLAAIRQKELEMGLDGKGFFSMVPDMHPDQEPVQHRVVGGKGNILLVGRWTTLDRKALSHDAQVQVRDFLRERIKRDR